MNPRIIIVCLSFIFLVLFTTFGLTENIQNKSWDYSFHFYNANGKGIDEFHEPTQYETYPPAFKWLSSLFAFNESIFFIFTLLFIGLLFPLVLFYLTDNWIIVWFYFSASSFFWLIDYYGFFSQALMTLLLVCFIKCKNTKLRIILLLVSLLVHNMGFYLLSLYWVIELILTIDWKHIFLACPTLLPKPSSPTTLGVKPSFYAFELSSVNELLAFILRDFNLIYIISAFKGFLDKKEFALIGFCLALFLIGFLNRRVWWTLSIILLLGLTSFYSTLSNKHKQYLILFSILTLGIQVYSFFVLKINNLNIC